MRSEHSHLAHRRKGGSYGAMMKARMNFTPNAMSRALPKRSSSSFLIKYKMQYLVFMAAANTIDIMVVHSRSGSHSWITYKCQSQGYLTILESVKTGNHFSSFVLTEDIKPGARFCLIWEAQHSQKYNTDDAKMWWYRMCCKSLLI